MNLLHAASRAALTVLALGLPVASMAIAPAPAGSLALGAPVAQLRAAAGAPRMVALLQAGSGKPAGLQVLDITQAARPQPRGFLPGLSGQLVLAPDGQRALVLLQPEAEKYNTATLHQLVAVDLGNPDAPRELWRRDLRARRVLLAPDASAWAASQPAAAPGGKWAITVEWLDATRPAATVAEDYWPAVLLSPSGHWLAWEDAANQLRLADLRTPGAPAIEQGYTPYPRYQCTVALLENGHVVVEDRRAPRMGLYAPTTGMPRVAALAHDGTAHCQALGLDAAGNLLVAGKAGVVRRLNVAQPASALFNGEWQLPPGLTPLAAAGAYLYAAGGNGLQIFRTDLGNATDVDWAALDKAHAAIMARYSLALRRGNKDAAATALAELEQAGAAMAPDSPIAGLPPRRAAAILGDFGQLLAQVYRDGSRYALAEFALKRSNVLDPASASAALNLADLWREHLPGMSDLAKRERRRAEITALYQRHVQLAGKAAAPHAVALASGEPAQAPGHGAGPDLCEAVARHANAGRLAELMADQAVSVALGQRRVDLVFSTDGTAHVPAVYGFDAQTDEPLDDKAVPAPGGEDLWGGDRLGLVSWHGTAQVLHYRDMKHPVETAPLAGGPTCRFATTTTERPGPKASERALCLRLPSGKGTAEVDFGQSAQITQEAVRERHGESEAGGMARLAFANDGVAVPVALIALSSGAGAGCEAVFFDLLDKSGQQLASGPRQRLLMKLQGADLSARFPLRCGNAARFFRHGGRLYFENRPQNWPPQDNFSQYHRVARVTGGVVRDVCDFQFESRVSVER